MKRIIVTLIFSSLFLMAQKPVVQLDDLIADALAHSPDLNVSQAEYEALKARIRQAEADRLPRADLDAGGGATGTQIKEAGSLNGAILTGRLSASQLLYDFGKVSGNIHAAGYEANASYALLKQAVIDKIFNVKKAYYNVLKAKMLIDVSRENVRLNEKQLYRAKRYFEAGIRTKIDVTDAKVNLITAKIGLQNAQYEYQRSKIYLASVIGSPRYDGDYTLYIPDVNISTLAEHLPDVNQPFEWLESYAYTHRPSLQSSKSRIESARARVEAVKADYYPQFYLSGDLEGSETDDAMQRTIPQHAWNAQVRLKWNLFEGYKTDARVQESRLRTIKAAAAYADNRIKIRKEVADSQEVLLKIRDSVLLSQSLVEAAKEKFHQAQKRYESGLSDFIELQQARQGYIDAAAHLVTNYYDFYIALAQRDRVIGK